MARRKSFTSDLYRAAGLSASGRAVSNGYAPPRAKDVIFGRTPGKAGVWRRLWR